MTLISFPMVLVALRGNNSGLLTPPDSPGTGRNFTLLYFSVELGPLVVVVVVGKVVLGFNVDFLV